MDVSSPVDISSATGNSGSTYTQELNELPYDKLKEVWQNSVQDTEEQLLNVALLRKNVPIEIRKRQEEYYNERFERLCAASNQDSDEEMSSPEKLRALAPNFKADEMNKMTQDMKERFERLRKLRAKNKRMEEELETVKKMGNLDYPA